MKTTTLTSLAASLALAALALTTGCVAPDETSDEEIGDDEIGDEEVSPSKEPAISGKIKYPTTDCGRTVSAYQTFLAAMHEQKNKTIAICGTTGVVTFGATCAAVGTTVSADNYATSLAPTVSAAVSTGGDIEMLGYTLMGLEGVLANAQTGSAFPSGWPGVWSAYDDFKTQLGACSASRTGDGA